MTAKWQRNTSNYAKMLISYFPYNSMIDFSTNPLTYEQTFFYLEELKNYEFYNKLNFFKLQCQ